MIRLLAKKYSQEFVVVSDLKETKSYGVRYVGGKVAATSDPSRSADAYVDDWGGRADNYSALGFKDQAEQGMRSVCAKAVGVISCTVELHVQPSTDRWDRLSFVDVMNASGPRSTTRQMLLDHIRMNR